MRILELRFKNLNSLVGEWSIDFTTPDFAGDGLFAITGPTGAGKTTILDALCLALYARTPRLKNVTKSENEIMSRQTGDCFAEVSFEVPAGRFRCQWSQHRARKKPDGELQPPKRELSYVATGHLIDSSISGVAEQVETLTGMNFERFTRSIMLAQGCFAAFLQAAPDQRGPILEQITGTEIYSELSRRVHERRSEERGKLEALEAELSGLRLLQPAEEQALCAELVQAEAQEKTLAHEKATVETALNWLNGIAGLQREAAELAQRKNTLDLRLTAFLPDKKRLEQGELALELAADHARVAALRTTCAETIAQEEATRQALAVQEARSATAQAALEQEQALHETTKREHQHMTALVRTVRDLDLRIREKTAPLAALRQELAAKSTEQALLEKTCAELTAIRKAKDTELELLIHEQERTAADAALSEQFAVIEERLNAIAVLTQSLVTTERDKELAAAKEQEAIQAWTLCRHERDVCREAVENLKKQLLEGEQRLQSLLAGRPLSAWHNELVEATPRTGTLIALSETSAALSATQTELNKVEASLYAATSAMPERERRMLDLQQEAHRLEREKDLLQRILSLAEHRETLRRGEPCPLCGAIEHPFMDSVSQQAAHHADSELNTVTATLRQVRETLESLRVECATATSETRMLESRRTELRSTLENGFSHIRKTLDLDPGTEPSAIQHALHDLRLAAEAHLAQLSERLQQTEAENSALTEQRNTLEKNIEQAEHLERREQEARHRQEDAAAGHLRGAAESSRITKQLEELRHAAATLLQAYGLELPPPPFTDLIQSLSERKEQWVRHVRHRDMLERETEALRLQAEHALAQHNAISLWRREKETAFDTLNRERNALSTERTELFGDKNPDAESSLIADILTQREAALEQARQQVEAAKREVTGQNRTLENLSVSRQRYQNERTNAEAAFQARLAKTPFADEAAYCGACLADGIRRTLSEQAKQLSLEQRELDTLLADNTARLHEEQGKQLTDKTLAELSAVHDEASARHRAAQERIGGLRLRLDDNEQTKASLQNRLAGIVAQQTECARWNTLHELIGSSDGKKYRNFAQGLTFEIMIGHANRQLRRMSDRYLLLRNETQPLELSIADSYQAGEIRSTKNLSGGESFIISLALALGLSHMASQNVRVDSLFLDEGFGTLDAEALETALETLASLRESGKVIGVISHVEALKERIPTQITVTPRTGGHSSISGPGCRSGGRN